MTPKPLSRIWCSDGLDFAQTDGHVQGPRTWIPPVCSSGAFLLCDVETGLREVGKTHRTGLCSVLFSQFQWGFERFSDGAGTTLRI